MFWYRFDSGERISNDPKPVNFVDPMQEIPMQEIDPKCSIENQENSNNSLGLDIETNQNRMMKLADSNCSQGSECSIFTKVILFICGVENFSTKTSTGYSSSNNLNENIIDRVNSIKENKTDRLLTNSFAIGLLAAVIGFWFFFR